MAMRGNTVCVFRGYAKDKEGVPGNVSKMERSRQRIEEITPDFFSHYIISIPGRLDTGDSTPEMKKAFAGLENVRVRHVLDGENFFHAPNDACEVAARDLGAKYVFFLSPEIIETTWTQDLVAGFEEGAANGAKFIGADLPMLQGEPRDGLLANTCGAWDLKALKAVNGFDPISAEPREGEGRSVMFWNEREGKIDTAIVQGVEERVVSARLFCEFGQCLWVVSVPPDSDYDESQMDADRLAKHQLKLVSKKARGNAQLYAFGYDPSLLKAALMNSDH